MVLLPEPDSPTRPRVSPCMMSRETPWMTGGAEVFDKIAGFEQGCEGHAAPEIRVSQGATWLEVEG